MILRYGDEERVAERAVVTRVVMDCDDCGGSGRTIGPVEMVDGVRLGPPDCERCGGRGKLDQSEIEVIDPLGGVYLIYTTEQVVLEEVAG